MYIAATLVWFLLFIVVFAPAAIVFRVFGKNPLRLKRERLQQSYWVDRPEARFSAMDRES